MASDEAVKAANGIAQMYHPALPDDLVAVAATMIDDHTAALRAEVEALRARVLRAEDLMAVWEWVNRNGGNITSGHISLQSSGTHRNFWRNADKEPVELYRAAKWVRNKSE